MSLFGRCCLSFILCMVQLLSVLREEGRLCRGAMHFRFLFTQKLNFYLLSTVLITWRVTRLAILNSDANGFRHDLQGNLK